MANFDFLLPDPRRWRQKKIYAIEPAACAVSCHRAMEFAVKWMYSVDTGLVKPYDDRLVNLLNAKEFRAIVDWDLWLRLNYIRQTGNAANHADCKPATPDEAAFCQENLWYFKDFVACCYGTHYTPGSFDRSPSEPIARRACAGCGP